MGVKVEKQTFENAKAGYWVFHKDDGWFKIKKIKQNSKYPIIVNELGYNLFGKAHIEDKYPTLLLHNPFDSDDTTPCEFKKGEVIAVSRTGENYVYDKFLSMIGIWCKSNNGEWKYARKLTAEEKGE